jgi:uncharacterized protein HemX
MSITAIILIVLALGMVFGGVLLLKQSAKKFNLTDEQLKDIKARNIQLDKEDSDGE